MRSSDQLQTQIDTDTEHMSRSADTRGHSTSMTDAVRQWFACHNYMHHNIHTAKAEFNLHKCITQNCCYHVDPAYSAVIWMV